MTAADSAPRAREDDWQRALREAVRELDELADLLELPRAALLERAAAHSEFPLIVPRSFVARMRKGDLDDPLLRQVLPLAREREAAPGFSADPLGERGVAQEGVLRKYGGRALLIASGACPVHCRYCFRREFPYPEQLAARGAFEPALARLRAEGGVEEVILSGGDPLSLSNRRLESLLAELAELPRIECVRIHTRFPVMIPERVDAGLVALLERAATRLVIVVHSNHAHEIDAAVAERLERLAESADFVLNQSVLLEGVNDDPAALAALGRRLFACRVLPYYLHLLDPVAGAGHFEVDEERARRIVRELQSRVPGYLVPRLVREVPGRASKTLV